MGGLDRAAAAVQAKPGGECCVRLNADSLHDLTSPVNQIGTLVDLILERHGDTLDSDAEAMFGFVQSSARRLQNMIAGLREYVEVAGPASRERLCDANQLLAGAQASLQAEIDRTGAAVLHDSLPEVWCDPNQVGYVFASLLGNAVKFRGERPPEIRVSATEQGDVWVFSIRDNGIGIAPAHFDRIFSMFKRCAGGEFSGGGAGLAIARHIIEQHGGRIWVESQLGDGATFYFSLRRENAGAA